jgi:hypothetical protein
MFFGGLRRMNMTTTPENNKALVLEAFDTLFNRRDYAAAGHRMTSSTAPI